MHLESEVTVRGLLLNVYTTLCANFFSYHHYNYNLMQSVEKSEDSFGFLSVAIKI